MAAPNWEKLKADAAETLGGINLDKLTKDGFILAGAAMGILSYPAEEAHASMPESSARLPEGTPEYYAEDELKSAENYLKMGLPDIARDEVRHAEYWIGRTSIANRQKYTDRQAELERQLGKSKPSSSILDDFSVILSKYNNTRTEVDRTAMRETLAHQLSAIEKELVEMRHEAHDPECVQMFVNFREALRLKI